MTADGVKLAQPGVRQQTPKEAWESSYGAAWPALINAGVAVLGSKRPIDVGPGGRPLFRDYHYKLETGHFNGRPWYRVVCEGECVEEGPRDV
jgi:hypothetical protein